MPSTVSGARRFRDGERVPRAGVLLALPAIAHSGIVEIAREVYGSIGPAFYGPRTTMVALGFLALLRIKRPEALKEHAPPRAGACSGGRRGRNLTVEPPARPPSAGVPVASPPRPGAWHAARTAQGALIEAQINHAL